MLYLYLLPNTSTCQGDSQNHCSASYRYIRFTSKLRARNTPLPQSSNRPRNQQFNKLRMPAGWERLNSKQSTPNKNIVFIKPLKGADENVSKEFLERIAAQCLPIMNKHHLAVVSLEEYEPNLEFWGKATFFHCSKRLIRNKDVTSITVKSSNSSLSPLRPGTGFPSNSCKWL
jgi:hypothetical protein